MSRRHLPRTWLLTDPRMGEGLWATLDRLPPGSGVILRRWDDALAARVRGIARRRGLLFIVAGTPRDARRLRADGVHMGSRPRPAPDLLLTASAHNRRELVAAERAGAALVFVSPLFATRSHPGTPALGRVRFGLLVREARVAVAALGGMTAETRGIPGAYGWGAIDAWLAAD